MKKTKQKSHISYLRGRKNLISNWLTRELPFFYALYTQSCTLDFLSKFLLLSFTFSMNLWCWILVRFFFFLLSITLFILVSCCNYMFFCFSDLVQTKLKCTSLFGLKCCATNSYRVARRNYFVTHL